ncbi:hypothetical protein O181_008775 [Austropuccinia psidii MF-1]|uniref:Uncharacterized protein n=1 Tax=Austropuccinia psidii MF-1 TaxID=1389203 RepID=A0A9Q3GJ80_9BASI|nr:hypothetical protein [Austropuccinia psidii MF-1]
MICPSDPPSPKRPNASFPPAPSSPQSHNEAWKEFTDLPPTLMIPQAHFQESISKTLLEHHLFLQIIPFVDATSQNEIHQEFREELHSLLGQALEAYPKEEVTGIVSIFLKKKVFALFSLISFFNTLF